jgi:hypothetical protein
MGIRLEVATNEIHARITLQHEIITDKIDKMGLQHEIMTDKIDKMGLQLHEMMELQHEMMKNEIMNQLKPIIQAYRTSTAEDVDKVSAAATCHSDKTIVTDTGNTVVYNGSQQQVNTDSSTVQVTADMQSLPESRDSTAVAALYPMVQHQTVDELLLCRFEQLAKGESAVKTSYAN